MAKKSAPLTEIYAVIDEHDELIIWLTTLESAKSHIGTNEINGGKILKVVQIWEGYYPEEPEIEFVETSLEEL
jgi:hypothetical protein